MLRRDVLFFFFSSIAEYFKPHLNNESIYKLTSGRANFRTLSPSVWRLTLALLVFCRGGSSPGLPWTSLEIGDASAASLERSSKSPVSLLAMLENGHSPGSFRSFSFAQNIFAPESAASLSLSNLGGRRCEWKRCGVWETFHHLTCARPGYFFLPSSLRPALSKRSAPKPGSTYNIHWNAACAKWWQTTIITKSQWEAAEKGPVGQSVRKRGWCSRATYQLQSEKFFPGDYSHAMDCFFVFVCVVVF